MFGMARSPRMLQRSFFYISTLHRKPKNIVLVEDSDFIVIQNA